MKSEAFYLDEILYELSKNPPKNYMVNEGNGFIPVKESEIYKKLKQ